MMGRVEDCPARGRPARDRLMPRTDAGRQDEVTMSTPASIKGHPIHPMLVALPVGLWILALVCDVLYKLRVSRRR
jgi:hypothetical protein